MKRGQAPTVRLPRPLHPGAWWVWAIGLATAATWTSNPLLLGLLVGVASLVVAARRSEAPWALGFRMYLALGAFVIVLRVVFRMILGGAYGDTILFTLPEIPLPDAAAGIRLGGPVSLEALVAAAYDGMRLATLLICIGAANVLADAKRLLKAVPAALHEIGVAVTVALSVAPQLITSARRIRAARRLRGGAAAKGRGRGRPGAIRGILLPVLEDALDRSVKLAAAMDVRGYGRVADVPRAVRRLTSTLVLVGLVAASIGSYGLLDHSSPRWLGIPMLVLGISSAVVAITLAGRRFPRTVYRRDPWRRPEWLVAGSGVVAAVVLVAGLGSEASQLHPAVDPIAWPDLPIGPTLAILLAATPAWLAPPTRVPEQAVITDRDSRPVPPIPQPELEP